MVITTHTEPDYTSHPTLWRVVSVILYDQDAVEIIRRDYSNFEIDISTELISNFVQTIESFSTNQFSQRVNELHLGNYILVFEKINDYILLAIVERGDMVNSGRNSNMGRSVRMLLERGAELLNLENGIINSNVNLKFLDNMVNKLNSIATSTDSTLATTNDEDLATTSDYFVTSVIITGNTGRTYISRSYEEGVYAEDPLLLSSLLSAINSFAAQITSLPFNQIVLDNYRIFIKNVGECIYVTTIELDNEDIVLNPSTAVSQRIEELSTNIIESTEFILNDKSAKTININHHTLTAVVDSIVIKSIQNTLGKKEIDRSQLDDVDVFNQKNSSETAPENLDESNDNQGFLSKVRGLFKITKMT